MRSLIFVVAGLCFLFGGVEGQCNASAVPVDEKFQENEFMGKWILWRTWMSAPVQPSFDVALHLVREEAHEGNDFHYTGFSRANVTSPCKTMGPFLVSQKKLIPGDLLFRVDSATLKVLELTPRHFVMFYCGDVGANGMCSSPRLQVYYRAGTKLNEKKLVEASTRHIANACVEPNYVACNMVTDACVPEGDDGDYSYYE